jgi:hypothetical protein
MSLFQCEVCGCCENTALSAQGCKPSFMQNLFDWSYAPERKGMYLCSVCAPLKYRDGEPTKFGVWHGEFPRNFLPMGEFKTNARGNLEHIEDGSEDFMMYEIEKPAHVK